MNEALSAFGRALRSLSRPAMIWHLVWPTLAALLLWGELAWFFWDEASATLIGWFQEWTWLHQLMDRTQFVSVAALATANILLAILFVPLIYATALMLVALVALPLMLERVAPADYPDLEKRKGGSMAGSVWNSLYALLVYLAGWLVTLPLWLIPGAGLLLPVVLSAYLNQRAYRYDALMQHADAGEMNRLFRQERGGLWLVGIISGLLAYVPVVNLVVPAYAGLAFAHYCLSALRRMRRAPAA
ncbi:MAG TPA: EI24 domain-containing protein [Rhodocyclaceae bacterium]|nr:EI24 domain-containing protein [Rhodocyclaceae bacterium]